MIKRLTTEEFIDKAKIKHGSRYNYSHVIYKTAFTKVIIECFIHGLFEQLPTHHLRGSGCRKCANQIINVNNGKEFSQQKFIDIVRSKRIINLSFDKVIYQGKRKDVIVTCSIHGDYTTKAEMLLKGNGCPNCKSSIGESRIKQILNSLNVEYTTQKTFKGLIFKKHLKFDFYLPHYNSCIEFDGIQHFQSVNYWKGKEGFIDLQMKDSIKNKYCELNGIRLLRVKFDNLNIEDTVTNFINDLKNN